MNQKMREYFDSIMHELPQMAKDMLQHTPVYLEDYPSEAIMQQLGVRHRSQLCGLYTGIPITERSVHHSGVPSDLIYIYREGVLQSAGCFQIGENEDELRKQMRITVLHELGHQNGLSEEDLNELGYG